MLSLAATSVLLPDPYRYTTLVLAGCIATSMEYNYKIARLYALSMFLIAAQAHTGYYHLTLPAITTVSLAIYHDSQHSQAVRRNSHPQKEGKTSKP